MLNSLPTLYQTQIHLTKYSRWQDDLGRRETWTETVDRLCDFLYKHLFENYQCNIGEEIAKKIRNAILNLDIMPSMRCMMTAGPALLRDNAAAYNCAYIKINRVEAFDEMMYLLMCGTGSGFSVERQYIAELPEIPKHLVSNETNIVVPDSKVGWCESLRALIKTLYAGGIPYWDLSFIRPSGEKLKTFGGRASGPAPLNDLFRYIVNTFEQARGRRLTSLECHGICCKIAEVVVAGGVRRSALISLSNPSDDRMRVAKTGQWMETTPHYLFSNNSACYTETPDMSVFFDEWHSLYKSKSGERGFFNRAAAQKKAKLSPTRNAEHEFGTNPCSEIILRDRELCNLSEVVIRSTDTYDSLKEKVILATILGTIQSTFTDFRYLSNKWKENCEEERLLGVSLTGIMDHPIMSGMVLPNGEFGGMSSLPQILMALRSVAHETNKVWADKFGINQSVAVTCVKPSGTVSQLVDSASGIHPRHSRYYIRTNQANKIDPVAQFMVSVGFPHEDLYTSPDRQWVFKFPIKSPPNAVYRDSITALEHLKLWQIYNDAWCDHKPSVTISIKEHEWMEVGAYVYKHFDDISGVSFLPFSNHMYSQAPYQECTSSEYLNLLTLMPSVVDWRKLSKFEKEDSGAGGYQEFACVGNTCEVI